MSEINKLRWRCRRGTLELDLMLLRYLERCYEMAEPSEQQSFLRLLELEDSELIHYLMGERVPANSALVSLVMQIRRLPVEVIDI